MMFWNDGSLAVWQIALMWAGMLIFWGLLIGTAVYFVKTLNKGSGPPNAVVTAHTILEERLARGEIDTDQYRQLLVELDTPTRVSVTTRT